MAGSTSTTSEWKTPTLLFLTGDPAVTLLVFLVERGDGLKYNKQHLGCVWLAASCIETNDFLIAFRDWSQSSEAGLALTVEQDKRMGGRQPTDEELQILID